RADFPGQLPDGRVACLAGIARHATEHAFPHVMTSGAAGSPIRSRFPPSPEDKIPVRVRGAALSRDCGASVVRRFATFHSAPVTSGLRRSPGLGTDRVQVETAELTLIGDREENQDRVLVVDIPSA